MKCFILKCNAFALILLMAAFVSPANAGTVTIAQDLNAITGNFQNPGSAALVGYTITTSDDGTNFNVVLFTTDPNASPFANLYFDTIASTPNTGSNLGFEFGNNTGNAFIPSTGMNIRFVVPGSGFTSAFAVNNGATTANITIPNSFFLTNPWAMPFAPTPAGTLVSLHLSQSFSLSVVGGSTNFAAPVELGDAIVGSTSTVPEPSSLVLVGFAMLGALGVVFKSKVGLV